MIKKIEFKYIVTCMLLAPSLLTAYNYDSSTVAPDKITIPIYTKAKPFVLPEVHTPSLIEGMIELDSYAEAIGRRFSYKISSNKIKKISPFNFEGGDIYALKASLEGHNLSVDVLAGSTIRISKAKPRKRTETRITTVVADAKDYAPLITDLKKINGVKNIKVIKSQGNLISFIVSDESKKRANEAVALFNAARNMNVPVKVTNNTTVRQIVEKMHPYKVIPPFEGESTVVNTTSGVIATMDQLDKELNKQKKTITSYPYQANGKFGVSFTLGQYEAIVLDRPYTIKTLVKKLGKQNGIDYRVTFDANIPVNKNVRIKKLEDLNKYLKATTGHSFKQKKKKGQIIIVPGGKY